ncbi:MAG TPA: type I restriction-modification system subunit M N-terminal domain-containing protein [Chloroflexota bacterium]|nr:type I restriction-modification system subunit M N-terminal domain-containing protein [Chloroflexota bacterium]
MATTTSSKTNGRGSLGFEETLWQSADQLRGNMDAAVYKHVVLGLIFLKYISNAFEARMGTIIAGIDRFMPWRSVDGEDTVPRGRLELQSLVQGALRPDRIIDLLRSFVLFEEGRAGEVSKKLAGYHQYFAVNRAVERTLAATSPEGDGRIGVIWHTQGSGKSLSMVFLVGKLFRQVELDNPTVVMLTDRNDLDNQLYAQFGPSRSAQLGGGALGPVAARKDARSPWDLFLVGHYPAQSGALRATQSMAKVPQKFHLACHWTLMGT